MQSRWFLLLLLLPHLAVGAVTLTDPMSLIPRASCPKLVLLEMMEDALANWVAGDGDAILVALDDLDRPRENADKLYVQFAERFDELRELILKSDNDTLLMALDRVTTTQRPLHLMACVMSEDCVLLKERGALLVNLLPIEKDEPESPTTGETKKAVNKKPERRRTAMKSPSKKDGGKVAKTTMADPNVPPAVTSVLLVRMNDLDSGVDLQFFMSVTRALVLYSEGRRLDIWERANQHANSDERDDLFNRFAKTPKFRRVYSTIRAHSASLAILKKLVSKRQYTAWDRMLRERAVQLAMGNLEEELSPVKVTAKNVFEIFEEISQQLPD